MGCLPSLSCTPLIHVYICVPRKHMVPDKGWEEGGAEGWVQGANVKSRLKVKTQETRGGRVLPGASDRLKTFFQSPLGPECEIPACHQFHSIRCQGHVPKIQGGERAHGWLSSFTVDTARAPNPTCPPAAHNMTTRLSGLRKGVASSPSNPNPSSVLCCRVESRDNPLLLLPT